MSGPTDPFDFSSGDHQPSDDGAWNPSTVDLPPEPPVATAPDWESVATHDSSFGTPGSSPAAVTVSPPLLLLGMAAGADLVALVLLVFARGNPIASFAAWVLAGPVCILIVGYFLGADADRRAQPYYAERSWTRAATFVLVAVGLVLAGVSAWWFADWVARR